MLISLIKPERFDLMAKLLYIKNRINNINSPFFIDLYKSHIITFNKAWEHPGTKKNIDDFIKHFNKLINSIKKKGYDSRYPIEIDKNHNNQLH